jgi:hypothetical protein
MAEALAALPAIAGPPAAPAGPAGTPRSPGSRGSGPVRSPADPGPADPGPADPGPADPGPADPGPADPGPGGPEPGAPAPLPIRSAERRRWAADLTGPALAGLVLYGAPGIGKSTLASQIASRVSHLEPGRVSVVISGEVSAEEVLAGVTAALLRHPALPPGSSRAESVRAAGRAGLPWAHRLALLRGEILSHTPVLLVLDNFDGNLTAGSGDRAVRDPALAELLANWAGATHRGKLLITCRHPFTPPAAARPPLGFRHVGPLSRSGAFELAKSLPALRQLGEPEMDRAWRLVGGHPQAMNYLDSLLASGEASFPDAARRLARAAGTADGGTAPPTGPAAPTELPPETAEAIALAAVELLLGTLQGPVPRPAQANGAHRRHTRAWPSRRLATIAAAVALVAAAAGVVVVSRPGPSMAGAGTGARGRTLPAGRGRAGDARAGHARAGHALARPASVLGVAAAVRTQAAAWVARQVSRDAIVACDPAMCSALLAQGITSGNLLELGPATPDPLGSDVVVATAAVRSQFGGRLASVYAPGILASFGSGSLRIDVRAVAPDGAAAYQAALAGDLAARRVVGRELLGNPHLRVSPAARAALRAGQVDPRLLTTLAVLAATTPAGTGLVQVSAFGDSGPGASAGMPLRSAQITVPSPAGLGRLRAMIAFVRAQRPPYLPARALITPGAGGSPVLSIGFSAPSPAGLLHPAQ